MIQVTEDSLRYSRKWLERRPFPKANDEGLTLETSAIPFYQGVPSFWPTFSWQPSVSPYKSMQSTQFSEEQAPHCSNRALTWMSLYYSVNARSTLPPSECRGNRSKWNVTRADLGGEAQGDRCTARYGHKGVRPTPRAACFSLAPAPLHSNENSRCRRSVFYWSLWRSSRLSN